MPNTERSPVATRSRTPTTPQPTTEAQTLQVILEELRRQREERVQFEAAVEARLQERDERWEQRINQLSPSNNFPIATTVSADGDVRADANVRGDVFVDASETACVGANASADVRTLRKESFKLKVDVFDGTAPWREFLTQFVLIARANGWDDSERAVALASCLRGKARSVLGTLESPEFSFEELRAKLELRFGEDVHAQNGYSQFTNRKQKEGEDFATLGQDLERLARLAYPECPMEVREKIACSQFFVALSDGFVKRALQLEGVASLGQAVERAKTIKEINGNSFARRWGTDDSQNFESEPVSS